MHNLFRLSSLASLEGYFYKPRMDRELLSTYAKGLIATTGCPSGEVQTYLRLGRYDEAVASAAEFRDIFGAGNYYVELMDHGLTIESRVRADLLQDRHGPQAAAGGHQRPALRRTRPTPRRTRCCSACSPARRWPTPNRFKFEGDGYYLKSPAEMRALFAELPEACDNTLAIAERCDVSFTEGNGTYMPRFPARRGRTRSPGSSGRSSAGCSAGIPTGVPDEVRQQAEFETEVILLEGLRRLLPGRRRLHQLGQGATASGSARVAARAPGRSPRTRCGSPTSTRCEHGLLFERFLNPERVSMPDFDIDFDERRRGEVIRYVTDKYGEDRVSQIVTYGTIKAKQAVKDASRVLGYPFGGGGADHQGHAAAGDGQGRAAGQDLRPRATSATARAGSSGRCTSRDADVKTVVDTALGLEGLKRQWGVHAAGVIMSSEPLIDIIPIMRREQDGAIITQFDYPTCESLGLIKMDFLGLRNLTVLDDAVDNIKLNRGFDLVLEDLPLDDPADVRAARPRRHPRACSSSTAGRCARCCAADAAGQLRRHLRGARALPARPDGGGLATPTTRGARPAGRTVTSIHPELAEPLAEILDETYGLIVYQEQVLQIAQKVAGYSLGKADLLRKAMGKKKKEVLDAEFVPFSERHDGERLLRSRRSRRCGTSWCRSPTTRSTRRTPRRTGWCRTGPPTSRPTTPASSWPRCSPRWPTTRTRWRSTSASAVGWASRCCRRTSTSPRPTSPRSAPTSASA